MSQNKCSQNDSKTFLMEMIDRLFTDKSQFSLYLPLSRPFVRGMCTLSLFWYLSPVKTL